MKRNLNATASVVMSLALALPYGALSAADSDDHSGMDHSGMDHSGMDMSSHSTDRDAEGRRLHGMSHTIPPEALEQLRENVPSWSNITAAEANLAMKQMGPNYEWYLSDDDLSGETGVLILLHGFRDRGDKVFKNQLSPLSSTFPTVLAPGMSMVMSQHIQLGLDDLTDAGAKTVIVIPIVSTEYNTMYRQWQYIFGLYDEPQYATVPKVHTDAKVIFESPPNDDPLVAEILLDYANSVSSDPDNEVVIIVAHGPSFADDNEKQLALMRNLAGYVKEDGGFSAVDVATLQDDAGPEIRGKNVERLRKLVTDAEADGKEVIIVTSLIGAYTIQKKLRKDLAGLDYNFVSKGLVQHPLFVDWMTETVSDELERQRTN